MFHSSIQELLKRRMTGDIDSIVGEKIARCRKRSGMSISTLATLTSLSELRIAQIESGSVRATVDELFSMKIALGVELTSFYDDF